MNVDGYLNDENSFPHNLLFTNDQVSKICKAFADGNIKLSETQLRKIGQSEVFLGRPLEPLLKSGVPLIENVLKRSAKSALITLGLTAAAAAAIDAPIHKKMFRSGFTILIISNEEMN